MAGIDFDELTKKIASYGKDDIRESLEEALSGVYGDNRIDAYAIILCEYGNPPTHQIISAGHANLLAMKVALWLDQNPALERLVMAELGANVLRRHLGKPNSSNL